MYSAAYPAPSATPVRPRSVVLAAVAATAALFGASAAVLGGPPTELVVAASPLATVTSAASRPAAVPQPLPQPTFAMATRPASPVLAASSPLAAASPAALSPALLLAVGAPLAALGTLLLGRPAARPAPLSEVALVPVSGARTGSRPATALHAATTGQVGERYEVELPKPIGVTVSRGNDGATYIRRVAPQARGFGISPGDKVVKCSAPFGTDMWEALNFGQVIFAIKSRVGSVLLELERRGGDLTIFEAKSMSPLYDRERRAGNYGIGTREEQERNAAEEERVEVQRREMYLEALGKIKEGKCQEAVITLENVIALESGQIIDMFEKYSPNAYLSRDCYYHMARAYSLLGNVEAALDSLQETLERGLDNFELIRRDPDLELLRETEAFGELMTEYGGSIFDGVDPTMAPAFEGFKSMFGGLFGGNKK